MYFGATAILCAVLLSSSFSGTYGISTRIQVHPMNTGFYPGDNLTLTCLTGQKGPVDVIDWYKDGQLLNSSGHSNSSCCAEISLINITKEDAGKYECEVRKNDEYDKGVFQLHLNCN